MFKRLVELSVKAVISTITVGTCSLVVFAIGCSKHPDNAFEEHIESVIEQLVEDKFGMPDGSLDGVIDLTPGSKES